MWLDAFGYLRSKTALNVLNLNGGFWSPKVMEQECIQIPVLDEVKLYNLYLQQKLNSLYGRCH
jgi:hypothetical protein